VGQVPDTDAGRVKGWAGELDALHAKVAWQFGRPEPRRRALAYLQGLLGQVDRKNSWQLASTLVSSRLMGCSGCWTRPAGTSTRSATSCAAMWSSTWVIPERCWWSMRPGSPKQGAKSVGVARQYTGTAGRIEHCQVGGDRRLRIWLEERAIA
jgi:SRSO17 transposase